MEIKKQHLPKGSKKRSGKVINTEFITIHSTGNAKSTAQNERDYLSNPINTNSTGWHYVVGDNIIIEAIPPNERAWHAGDGSNGPGNNKSVGIEMVETGNRDKVIENTIWLVNQLQNQFNIPDSKVVRHHDWSGKNCPRILNSDGSWGGWVEFKTLLRSSDTMSREEVKKIVQEELDRSKLPVSSWAKNDWDKAKEDGVTDGSRPRDFATREEVIALINRSK